MDRRTFLQSSLSMALLQTFPGSAIALARSTPASTNAPNSTNPALTRSDILVAGLGGAGTTFVRELATERLGSFARFRTYDSPDGHPSESHEPCVHTRCEDVRPVDIDGTPLIKRIDNPTEFKRRIRQDLDGVKRLFIVAGIGGRTGTILAPIFAETARGIGIHTTAIVTHPFLFEPTVDQVGIWAPMFAPRHQQAWYAHEALNVYADTRIMIPNEAGRWFHVTDAWRQGLHKPSFIILEALQSGKRQTIQAARSLIKLQTSPGDIPVETAAMDGILAEAGFGFASNAIAGGDGRIAEATRIALSSPYLGDDWLKRRAKGAVVVIHSNGGVSRQEITQVEQIVKYALRRDTPVVIGTVHDDLLAQNLTRVTILLSGLLRTRGGYSVEVGRHIPMRPRCSYLRECFAKRASLPQDLRDSPA